MRLIERCLELNWKVESRADSDTPKGDRQGEWKMWYLSLWLLSTYSPFVMYLDSLLGNIQLHRRLHIVVTLPGPLQDQLNYCLVVDHDCGYYRWVLFRFLFYKTILKEQNLTLACTLIMFINLL